MRRNNMNNIYRRFFLVLCSFSLILLVISCTNIENNSSKKSDSSGITVYGSVGLSTNLVMPAAVLNNGNSNSSRTVSSSFNGIKYTITASQLDGNSTGTEVITTESSSDGSFVLKNLTPNTKYRFTAEYYSSGAGLSLYGYSEQTVYESSSVSVTVQPEIVKDTKETGSVRLQIFDDTNIVNKVEIYWDAEDKPEIITFKGSVHSENFEKELLESGRKNV